MAKKKQIRRYVVVGGNGYFTEMYWSNRKFAERRRAALQRAIPGIGPFAVVPLTGTFTPPRGARSKR